jgi:hypothetical protein
MINNGDIFITKLDRNFFGAFRVIKTKGKFDFSDYEFFIISITSFIDTKKPEINDIRLTQPLIEKRFLNLNNSKPSIAIYPQSIFKNKFEYLGNIPIDDFEKNLKFKIGGKQGLHLIGTDGKDFGYEAFYEWRWINEKEKFIEEVEEQEFKAQKEYNNRILSPKKMMDDNEFWEIISLLDWQQKYEDKIIEPVIKHLSKLKVSEIKLFEENLTFKLYCLDTKEHAKNIGKNSYIDNDSHFSVDFFLYSRCKAVANGKLFYELVLNNPSKMPKDEEFEVLLDLSDIAYELKTKKELDYSTGCDYETFSNKEGWR